MFNFNLYKEGLRKTKTLAILFLAVMILAAILQPVGHLMEHADRIRYGWHWMQPVIHIYGLDASFISPFAFFIGAPMITLSMFNFLTKRNSSDFYHAIPHKRSTLFVSFIAATLTWVVGGMWLAAAISTSIYASSPHTVINLGSVIGVQMGLAAACLLVVSAFALAISVTGTKLSNFMTGLLILFLPRFVNAVFISLVISSTRVTSFGDFGFFGSFTRHIPFGFFSYYAINESIHQMIIRGTLYTFVLGIIYLALAGYFFVKRHSELATNPGTKVTQPLIRVAVTFLITLPAIGIIIDHRQHNHGGDTGYFLVLIAIYAIALIAYFAYEFLTAKKLPKFIKMLPGIGVVILLNLAFIWGIALARHQILQTINPTDVSSITLVEVNTNSWSWSYSDINLRGLNVSDEQVTVLLADVLNENVRNSRQWWQGRSVRVTFHMEGSRDITRTIRITDQRLSMLANLLSDYEPYRDIVLNLPEDPDFIELRNFLAFESDWESEWLDLSQDELQGLFQLIREEIQDVDFEAWYGLVGNLDFDPDMYYDPENLETHDRIIYGQVSISGSVNNQRYTSRLPITELTPRTLERFLELAGYE